MSKKIIFSVIIFIIVVILFLLLYPYFLIPKYGFPIIKRESNSFKTNFYVCENALSQERIYLSSWCGDDSCFKKYYDKKGKIIESGEFGPGTLNNKKPKIKTKDCLRTTKLYFKIKIKE